MLFLRTTAINLLLIIILLFLLGDLSSVFLIVLKEVSLYSDMENKIRLPIELPTDRSTSIPVPVLIKVYLCTTTLETHPVKQEIVLINSSFKGCRKFN